MNGKFQETEIDLMTEDLRDAAWDVLHENPGVDCRGWLELLIRQFPTEVIDALGTDPDEINTQLTQWWSSLSYLDEVTGLQYTYREWAGRFHDDRSVKLYDEIVTEMNKRYGRLNLSERLLKIADALIF